MSGLDDDTLLDQQINRHQVDLQQRQPLYFALGFVLSLLPTYLFQALNDVDCTSIFNLLVFLAVIGLTSTSFVSTYHRFFQAQWQLFQNTATSSPKAKSPTKKDKSAFGLNAEARNVEGFKAAMAWALFFTNLVFLVSVLFLQFYLLRAFEPRLKYLLSMLIPAGALYWLSFKNEKTVSKRRFAKRA